MNLRFIFVLCLILIGNIVIAGEITLRGTYQGKDVFVQNPFNSTTKSFCTTGVYINGARILDAPAISAFKIDLSHFSEGESIEVRIEYNDGCAPLIVNPTALKSIGEFQFMNFQVDHNSISWTSTGEKGGEYLVYHESKENNWTVIDTVKARGSQSSGYSRKPSHRIGDNKYQIKYIDKHKEEHKSDIVIFTASENYITFYPQIATTSLILSDTCVYEIEDYFGKIVKKGIGIEVPVTNIKPGKYYLIIQNRKEQFIKR